MRASWRSVLQGMCRGWQSKEHNCLTKRRVYCHGQLPSHVVTKCESNMCIDWILFGIAAAPTAVASGVARVAVERDLSSVMPRRTMRHLRRRACAAAVMYLLPMPKIGSVAKQVAVYCWHASRSAHAESQRTVTRAHWSLHSDRMTPSKS